VAFMDQAEVWQGLRPPPCAMMMSNLGFGEHLMASLLNCEPTSLNDCILLDYMPKQRLELSQAHNLHWGLLALSVGLSTAPMTTSILTLIRSAYPGIWARWRGRSQHGAPRSCSLPAAIGTCIRSRLK